MSEAHVFQANMTVISTSDDATTINDDKIQEDAGSVVGNASLATNRSSYLVQPDIPGWLFTSASVYMALIGVFGIVSNLAVLVAYLRIRAVSTARNSAEENCRCNRSDNTLKENSFHEHTVIGERKQRFARVLCS